MAHGRDTLLKRSSSGTADSPNKKKRRRKKESLSDLKVLGEQLLTSRAHINNVPILLEFISPNCLPQYVLESLLSLQSFFTPLLSQPGTSSLPKCSDSDSEPDFVYRIWLRSKFDEFILRLISVAVSSESQDALKEVVIDSIMDFVKEGDGGKFHSAIYHKLICGVVNSQLGVDDIIFDLLHTKYFSYIDVRYFSYISLEKLARTVEGKVVMDSTHNATNVHSSTSNELSIRRIHCLLSNVPPFESSDENLKMWSSLGMYTKKSIKVDAEYEQANSEKYIDKVLSPKKVAKKMKLKFSKAWVSFLGLELPLDVYKEVLATLHQDVIPYLYNPSMLCDFLTRSYDIGGVVSVMALSSLFILMTQHGLEYPNFYNKLYGLLEPSIFMAKYRSKFFQLLDSCLKSSLLPAYLAASFCKKLSRLALFVPPSGALVVISLVHNILQRHPSIYFLVHQEGTNTDASGSISDHSSDDFLQGSPGLDHFIFEESDPRNTNAMRSSLWEIDTLRHHYCPAVSRFVLSFENDFSSRSRSAEIDVKDFCSGSHATIFNDEIRRRVKQVPLAFYSTTPTKLFSESDFPGWKFDTRTDGLTVTAAGKSLH